MANRSVHRLILIFLSNFGWFVKSAQNHHHFANYHIFLKFCKKNIWIFIKFQCILHFAFCKLSYFSEVLQNFVFSQDVANS